jgi:hypothetical protein
MLKAACREGVDPDLPARGHDGYHGVSWQPGGHITT